MEMKAKTYGINFVVASNLQLNIFSHELLTIKKFVPYFYLHLIFCDL
jgi:hypothetical protein